VTFLYGNFKPTTFYEEIRISEQELENWQKYAYEKLAVK